MYFKTSPRGLHSPSRSVPCCRPGPGTLRWVLEVRDGLSLVLLAGILAAHLPFQNLSECGMLSLDGSWTRGRPLHSWANMYVL